jgi:hypothetical protein
MNDSSSVAAFPRLWSEAKLLPQRHVGALLSVSLATAAWLSQLPYPFWPYWRYAMLAGALLTGASGVLALWLRRREPFEARDVFAGVCLAAFVSYITLQRTVAGDHSLWIFVLPTVLAIFVARDSERALAFSRFELLFIICLLPGVVYLLLMIAGVPLTFASRPAQNARFAAAGVRMLQLPGAVFLERNSQTLPWGGVISRLCGMYDEPGMVGTVAALLLAARGFEVRRWRGVLLYVSGLLSLSLAFVVLAALGFAARTVVTRRWTPLVLAMPVLLCGVFVLGWVTIPRAQTAAPRVVVEAPGGSSEVEALQTRGTKVRQTDQIDNRSQPPMDQLFERYEGSGWTTIVFGIASNASSVYGGASSVWTRILVDHGLLGFVLLLAAFVAYGWSVLRRSGPSLAALVFLGAFALSFYQRPMLWVPYNLVLFFGAAAVLERAAAGRRRRDGGCEVDVRSRVRPPRSSLGLKHPRAYVPANLAYS